MTYEEEYKDCLEYIESYWDNIIFKPSRKKIQHHVITIPYPYITPNDKRFDYIFYWDTYFIIRGLFGTKRERVMKNMVNNFAHIFERYGIIPNFNSPASTGVSQPPFFSSMIIDTYNYSIQAEGMTKKIVSSLPFLDDKLIVNKKWLENKIELAKQEYWNVWRDHQNLPSYKMGANTHTVKDYLLSRYGDKDAGYALNAERESGWDFTSRFYNRANEFLPIDLNCFLYKYEKDFSYVAKILKNDEEQQYWKDLAEKRKLEINSFMWNEKEGFFYDYGFKYKRQSEFLSLAGFTPMWVGLATAEQAEKMVQKIKEFESDYGLIITDKDSLAKPIDLSKVQKRYQPAIRDIIDPKQWDYPHIWPPLEYLTVIGLLRYGYVEDAQRIMKKSINVNAKLFRTYGTFFEKINGVTGDKPDDFHYPTQTGFGWTNAIFYRYVQLLDSLEQKKPLIDTTTPPPYRLLVAH